MLTVGTPADAPAAGDILVQSTPVTLARHYKVRVLVASEVGVWVTLVHRRGGAAVSSIFLPVTGPLLGPLEAYETYFAVGDYVEVSIRDGAPGVTGTVQASVELV